LQNCFTNLLPYVYLISQMAKNRTVVLTHQKSTFQCS